MNMVNRIGSFGKSSNNKSAMAAVRDEPLEMARWKRLAHSTLESAEGLVTGHPVVCLTAALTAGIAVGWWVKRR